MKRKRTLSFFISLIFLSGFFAAVPVSKVSAAGAANLAYGKPTAASSVAFRNLSLAADGVVKASNYADSYTAAGRQWVQVDLGASHNINNIRLWHYFGDARTYHDVVVMVSNNSSFTAGSYTIVYNNDSDNSSGFGAGKDSEYSESSAGKDMTFTAVNARYVRLYSNGSNINSYNHYGEIQVFEEPAASASNLAGNILPTAQMAWKNLSYATDGIISTSNYADSSIGSGLQYIQINLGSTCLIDSVKLWHYFGDARRYRDVIVQVSNDPSFSNGVTTVYSNDSNNSAGLGAGSDSEYSETSAGKEIDFPAVNAQYVRLYSNGSNVNNFNHYTEVQVFQAAAPSTDNLAAGKQTSTSSSGYANLSCATDGIINTSNYADSYKAGGAQWLQIDLGASNTIDNIKLRHYFGDSRKYHDVIVQLSNDADFSSGVSTVYNNDTNNSTGLGTGANSEYPETVAGLSVTFAPVNARYVRLYSNGSTVNNYNHYGEVEVYAASNAGADLTAYNAALAAAKAADYTVASWNLYQEIVKANAVTASCTQEQADAAASAIKGAQNSLVKSALVNVKNYGAKGDGAADDTAAIQSAINYAASIGGTVSIPDGTYMINADTRLRLKSNVRLCLSKNAVLKAKASSNESYVVISVLNASDVEITGGKIVGERDVHLGTTGEWGHGISVRNSKNIHIADVSVTNCWGDGMYIGAAYTGTVGETNYCENVVIERCTADSNRRNGISIISVKKLLVKDCVLSNSNGTKPQAGIDFEPNYSTEFMQNVVVENLKTINNADSAICVSLSRIETSANEVDITISNWTDSGSTRKFSDLSAFELNHMVVK